MTRPLPSDRQRDELLGVLIALTAKVGKKGDQKYAAELLVERVRRAIVRDRSGTSIPDGYPRGTSLDGGSGGGLHIHVEDERGDIDSVPVTGVEWAMFERAEQRKSLKDHHRDLTRGMWEDIERAVRALDDANAKLARIDNLVDTNPNASTAEKGCTSCARYQDWFYPADGRRGLCQFCNGWRSEHDDELPPVAIIERRARGQRITQNVVDEVLAAKKRRSA